LKINGNGAWRNPRPFPIGEFYTMAEFPCVERKIHCGKMQILVCFGTKEVQNLSKSYRVKIWNDTGIPAELERYCKEKGVSVNAFVNKAIAEKLERTDAHSMTIAEIEEAERGDW